MLGRKQNSKNEDWILAWKHCTDLVNEAHIQEITNRTIQRIKAVIEINGFRRVSYAWSGGKDSIVLYDILRKSGIARVGGVLALYEHEFPAFLDWIEANRPADVQIVKTYAFTDDFLNKHPEYIFPMETKYKDAYLPPRWKVQNNYIKQNQIDCMIMGRRIADGNNCGKRENGFVTMSQAGAKFNPLADWMHEEILAYIQYNGLELPPTYFYENGFQAGTQAWTEKRRINGHFFETFDLLMSIDPRIVESVKGRLEIADEYLHYKNHGGTIK